MDKVKKLSYPNYLPPAPNTCSEAEALHTACLEIITCILEARFGHVSHGRQRYQFKHWPGNIVRAAQFGCEEMTVLKA